MLRKLLHTKNTINIKRVVLQGHVVKPHEVAESEEIDIQQIQEEQEKIPQKSKWGDETVHME
jgi:hypothetical protein